MPRANNPKLGTIACDDCGAPSSVKQNAKGFLYVGCQECGVDMRKGAKLQARLWNDTQWEQGAEPKQPPNVPTGTEVSPEPAEPKPVPKKEPTPEPKPEEKTKGGWAVLAGLAALILFPLRGGK